MSGAHILDLPDSILFSISFHACLDDTFRLGLSCSRLHRLFSEPYWRWRAHQTGLEFQAHPSAIVQFFGALKGFCRHCSSPLLYSWEETRAERIPLWMGRIHNVFPDAILHDIMDRYFCHRCINLEEYHFVHQSCLVDLGLSIDDMHDAPYKARPDGLYFTLDVINRKRRQRMDWLNAWMKQMATSQGLGPGTTLAAPSMPVSMPMPTSTPHLQVSAPRSPPPHPHQHQQWNNTTAPAPLAGLQSLGLIAVGQPSALDQGVPSSSRILQLEHPSMDRRRELSLAPPTAPRPSSTSMAAMSPPHSSRSCAASFPTDASATHSPTTPLTSLADSRPGSHLEGVLEPQREDSPEDHARSRAARKHEANRVREAQDGIMRAVKRDQLEEALRVRGVLLTGGRELEPEAQNWIKSEWVKLKELGIFDVEGVAEALCQKWCNVLIDWERGSPSGAAQLAPEDWSPRRASGAAAPLTPQRELSTRADDDHQAFFRPPQADPPASSAVPVTPKTPSVLAGAGRLSLPPLYRPIAVHGRRPAPVTDPSHHGSGGGGSSSSGGHPRSHPTVAIELDRRSHHDDGGDGEDANSEDDAYGEHDADADLDGDRDHEYALASGLVAAHTHLPSDGSPHARFGAQPAQLTTKALYTDVDVHGQMGAFRHDAARR